MVGESEPLQVLIVDDEPSIRLLLRRWVERSVEADVAEAEDGLQALEKISESRVDLLITDLKMPVLNGTDLLTLLQADPRRSRMEVLVATQVAGEETVRDAIKLGASDYLLKPLQYDWVVQRIRRAHARLAERRAREDDQDASFLPRLLVVDADRNFLHAAQAALAGRFSTKEADNAAAALVQALRFKPEVVLAASVPGLTLDFLVQRLRSLPGYDPPLILELLDPGAAPAEPDLPALHRTFVPDKLLAAVVEATGGEIPASSGLCESLEKDAATAVLQGFGMMAGEEPELADSEPPEAFEIYGSISLESSERRIDIELHCGKALETELVTAMLGEAPEDDDGSMALGEMLNVVAGRIKNSCEGRGMDLQLGLPEVDDKPTPQAPAGDRVEKLFLWRGMALFLRLSARPLG